MLFYNPCFFFSIRQMTKSQLEFFKMLDQKIAEVCFHTKSVDQSMKCNSCLRFYQSLMLSVQNFINNFSQLFCLILSITKWEQLGGEAFSVRTGIQSNTFA